MLPFKQLKDIEQLRKISGVYFLCWNNEVVYVGQSVNVIARIGQHLSGFLSRYKGEIGAYFLECDEGLLGLVERHYILFFMPCENRFIPSGCDEKHIEYYNNKRMIKAHEYKLQRKKFEDEIIERYEKRKRKAAQRKKRKIKTAEQLREEGKLIFLYKEQEVMIND